MRVSDHFRRVIRFMFNAGQEVPAGPVIPSKAVRVLRAKLIFEEAVKELIAEGLAIDMVMTVGKTPILINTATASIEYVPSTARQPDLVKIADGAADTNVVVTGTMIACGISDIDLQELVDNSNLSKFTAPTCSQCGKQMFQLPSQEWVCDNHAAMEVRPKESGYYVREDGKLIKSPAFVAPDIAGLLEVMKRDEHDYNMLEQDPIMVMEFTYKNHRGEVAKRRASPIGTPPYFGKTDSHSEKQWFIDMYDQDRKLFRSFAMADMSEIKKGE